MICDNDFRAPAPLIKRNARKPGVLFSLLAAALLFCGCSSPWITNTPRSVIKQYPIVTTVERAVGNSGLKKYAGRKIYLDYTYLAPQIEKTYAQGMIEQDVAKTGCLIAPKQEETDLMIPPLCGWRQKKATTFLKHPERRPPEEAPEFRYTILSKKSG